MNKLLNYIAQVFFLFFSSTGGVFRAFCCAVWQWYTEHQTGNAPKATILLFFYQTDFLQWSYYWSHCQSLARARNGNRESRIENRYCTRDKKRSPSKEQLMQCKSFKLLRIANSGLQAVKELLRSVQIIKELWRPVSHGDCRTTHKVE